MIERRRRFLRGDSLLDIPFSPVPEIPVQFARLFQSATGIIIFSQVVIATSMGIEKLMTYVESLSFVIGRMQITASLPVFAALSDLRIGGGIFSAGLQRPGKRRLFRGRLFLVHRGSFSTSARRDLGSLGLHAKSRDRSSHV